jgi:hypothetical protein
LTLNDVARGSWIEQFKGDFEVYRKTLHQTI